MPEVLEQAQATAAEAGASITFTHDMDEAFAGADVVYPKSWGRLDAFSNEKSALAESAEFKDWICDARRLALASPDVLYMHRLPADRGTRSRTRSSTGRTRSCTTRPRTGCTPGRRSVR